MYDLRVDFSVLEQTGRMLSAAMSDFAQVEAWAAEYGMSAGSSEVAAALSNFAGNWANHRRNLQDSVQNLGTMVVETSRSFHETDMGLGHGLSA
jgi:predicted unusual protein kinase regulating ubiquinone biosynthesis (AarF/ABC1/UbiB family)